MFFSLGSCVYETIKFHPDKKTPTIVRLDGSVATYTKWNLNGLSKK